MIPLFYPPTIDLYGTLRELESTLASRWWGQGPKVDLFEKRFAEEFGLPVGVMTNSGTAALHLAYRLAGVGPGDEVIVPVLTCTATCHPVLLLGAKVVFADVDRETLCADTADVERKITKRTKAVVTVHLGGCVDGMDELAAICGRRKIALVEDAAQALGAKGLGKADFTCFSFQAIKHLTTGDGGMLVCRREFDRKRAKRLRWFDIDREQKIRKGWQAWDRRGITFDQREPGYKYQPNDIAASLGLAGLEMYEENRDARTRLAKVYRDALNGEDWIRTQALGDDHANWLMMVYVDCDRNDFADHLRRKEVETNVAHVRNDLFRVFGGKRLPLPGMNEMESKYLCLPLHDHLTTLDVERVCMAVLSYGKKRIGRRRFSGK